MLLPLSVTSVLSALIFGFMFGLGWAIAHKIVQ